MKDIKKFLTVAVIALIFLGVMFRPTIGIIVSVLSYLPLIFLFFVSLRSFLFKSLECDFVFFLLFSFYLIFLIGLNFFKVNNSSILGGVIGFVNLSVPCLFWITVKKLGVTYKAPLILIYVTCVINAVGALVQYFLSPDIFGLISHAVYTNEEIFSLGNVLKRAVSFISAPQSLSVVLAIGTFLSIRFFSGFKRYFFLLLFITSGILTISKAFYLVLFISFLPFLISKLRFFLPLILTLPLFTVNPSSKIYDRIFKVVDYLKDFSSYPAYEIWASAVNIIIKPLNVIMGAGLGIASRGAQQIMGYSYDIANKGLAIGSTESFFLQVWLETGLLGVLLLGVFYIKRIIKIKRSDLGLNFLVLGVLFSSFFTPALYGFTLSLVFYYFLVFGDKIEFKKR